MWRLKGVLVLLLKVTAPLAPEVSYMGTSVMSLQVFCGFFLSVGLPRFSVSSQCRQRHARRICTNIPPPHPSLEM